MALRWIRVFLSSLAVTLASTLALGAAYNDYLSAKQKFDLIEADRLRPGSRVALSPAELTAYAEREAPPGVRQPQIRIAAPGIATGTALVDFNKLNQGQGGPSGWLLSKLLDGERPVSVTARITSSNGHAQVDVRRVEVSGLDIDGATLDFLVRNVLLPLYPDAAVGRPFELGHRVDSLDIQPNGVSVLIGR